MKKFCLLCLIILYACTSTPHQKQVTYMSTIDGDTLEMVVDGKVEHVRLLLIDTPESVAPNKKIQPYALDAKARVKMILENAKVITIAQKDYQTRDKYGRLLAYVYADGTLVQQILVEDGYARVAYYQKGDTYLTQLKNLEKIAKNKKLNIWSIDGYVTSSGFKE